MDTIISIALNKKITFEQVDDEYCIFNEETNRISTLNSTAGEIFSFLLNTLRTSDKCLMLSEIVTHLKAKFDIPDELARTVEIDVEMTLASFRDEAFFVFS